MTHNARLIVDKRYRMAFKQAMEIRRSRRQAIRAAERISTMLAAWARDNAKGGLGGWLPPQRDWAPGAVVLPLYRMTRDVR